ncbi:MAG: DinB family protein [Bacteroidia bacterium]
MENWSEQIDNITQDFIETFSELSPHQLNWKPASDTWSIAQNIDHLIVINSTYFPVIDSIRAGNYKPPFLSKFGFIVSFFGNFVLRSVQPDRKRRMKTFPIWEPDKSEIPQGILDRFAAHQLQLKTVLENSRDLVDQGVIISSPANRNIVYKLEKAFEIIVAHEQRHFEQSREVYQLLQKDSTISRI